jgi:nitronate monooxygenase
LIKAVKKTHRAAPSDSSGDGGAVQQARYPPLCNVKESPMLLRTRLTERLGIEHPVISAPMGFFAGGRLAAAVSDAGGLGMIGGGYGDPDWLEQEFAAAGNARIGCGFITWALAQRPALLDQALTKQPAALMLSFGAPAPFAAQIKHSGVLLICQVQSVAHARAAIDAGADVIVAQGSEAGGHSGRRSTFTLVPEVADLLGHVAPETLLVAAGGIADGRGLAAALMLGADGVLIGSRLVASAESAVPQGFHDAIVAADGDATIKTTVIDIVRNYNWPSDEFEVRALRNQFTDRWHGREADLAEPSTNKVQNELYWKAFRAGDAQNAGVLIGEAAGLIREIQTTSGILEGMVVQARQLLAAGTGLS